MVQLVQQSVHIEHETVQIEKESVLIENELGQVEKASVQIVIETREKDAGDWGEGHNE